MAHYRVLCLAVRELLRPVADALVHELVDDPDPAPERRLGADVEEPHRLPEGVDVAEQRELAGVVERRGEAGALAGAAQRVEVQAEGDGEDGVHGRPEREALELHGPPGRRGAGDNGGEPGGVPLEDGAAEVAERPRGEVVAGHLPLLPPLVAIHGEDAVAEQVGHVLVVERALHTFRWETSDVSAANTRGNQPLSLRLEGPLQVQTKEFPSLLFRWAVLWRPVNKRDAFGLFIVVDRDSGAC
jgi:hypothetical protein